VRRRIEHMGKVRRLVLRDDEGEWVGAGDTVHFSYGITNYHTRLMDEGYDESYQIAAPTGSIVFFDMVTYGYGDTITWEKLEKQKGQLEQWAKDHATEFCYEKWEILVTANYW
jgi:hypothetical protein